MFTQIVVMIIEIGFLQTMEGQHSQGGSCLFEPCACMSSATGQRWCTPWDSSRGNMLHRLVRCVFVIPNRCSHTVASILYPFHILGRRLPITSQSVEIARFALYSPLLTFARSDLYFVLTDIAKCLVVESFCRTYLAWVSREVICWCHLENRRTFFFHD